MGSVNLRDVDPHFPGPGDHIIPDGHVAGIQMHVGIRIGDVAVAAVADPGVL